MNGKAWVFPTGIAPLGNSHHFLYQEQIALARARKSAPENNYQTIITGYPSCPEERVNFVLNPPKTYPDAFPEFSNERSVEHNLECLRPRSKDLVKSTVFHNTISDGGVSPIVPFNRFSKLEKLIKATEFAFRFIHKARQLNASDPGHNARINLSKIMQQQTFQKEITYLKDPRDTPPDLVKNLNIFLDDEGILRMDGRIAQTSMYDYERIYPILLAKYYH